MRFTVEPPFVVHPVHRVRQVRARGRLPLTRTRPDPLARRPAAVLAPLPGAARGRPPSGVAGEFLRVRVSRADRPRLPVPRSDGTPSSSSAFSGRRAAPWRREHRVGALLVAPAQRANPSLSRTPGSSISARAVGSARPPRRRAREQLDVAERVEPPSRLRRARSTAARGTLLRLGEIALARQLDAGAAERRPDSATA